MTARKYQEMNGMKAITNLECPGHGSVTTLTISSGNITPVHDMHLIDGEGAASDTLSNILNTESAEYDEVFLYAGAQAITVEHNAGGVGSIFLLSGINTSLSPTVPMKIIRRGTDWYETGASSGSSSALFGDGSDGDVVISSNTTLTEDKNYNNLTVDATFTLNTGGFIVRVLGTLLNNGIITDEDSGGSAGAFGVGGNEGIIINGYRSGNGGEDGEDGDNGTGSSFTAGGAGGTGGKGGGVVIIYASTLNNVGLIHANGEDGGNGGGGVTGAGGTGGGGGGGSAGTSGIVLVTYSTVILFGTIECLNGKSGTGGGGGSSLNVGGTTGGAGGGGGSGIDSDYALAGAGAPTNTVGGVNGTAGEASNHCRRSWRWW